MTVDATRSPVGDEPPADDLDDLDDLDDIEFTLGEIENKIAPLALA